MFGRKNKNPDEVRRPGTALQSRQNVFSYYANRSPLQANTGRGETRRDVSESLFARFHKVGIVGGVFVGTIVLLYTLTLNPTPRIVMMNGANRSLTRASNEYQSFMAAESSKSLLNRSKLTVDTTALAERLQARFPEVTAADITVPLVGRTPVVNVSTIAPVFVLSSGRQYYVTPEGRAMSVDEAFTSRPENVVIVYDESGLPVASGDQVLTRNTVSFIEAVVTQMQAKQLKIASMTLPKEAFELRMRLEGVPYYVRFNTLGDARLQSGAFLSVKAYAEGQKQSPAEYVDVRVEDRAYYK